MGGADEDHDGDTAADGTPEEAADTDGTPEEAADTDGTPEEAADADESHAADTEGSEDAEAETTAGEESTGDAGIIDRVRGLSARQLLLRGTGLVTLLLIVLLLVYVPTSILGLVINDSATFDGSPAAPGDETLEATGYELNDSETVTVERELTVGGQTKTIVVNNPQRVYRNRIQTQNRTVTAGLFAVASTPTVTVAGSSRNPIAGMSHREILQRFQSELDVGDDNVTFEKADTHEAVLVKRPTSVTEFRANISVDGEKRDFAIYVTTAQRAGDIVITIGAHPTAFADERVSIMRLIYAVEHSN